jgi:AcrR family transcriptional regulator
MIQNQSVPVISIVVNMRTRNSLTKARIVATAIEHVDKHRMDSLTLRALGDELKVHHTAMYRHFRNKDDLVNAMFDYVVFSAGQMVASETVAARSRVKQIAAAFRAVLHQHPVLVGSIVHARGSNSSLDVERVVVDAIREMGCPEDKIAVHYQMIETYVFGSVAFDFAGAPDHLESRRVRHHSSGSMPMVNAAKSSETIDDLNERAFAMGLDIMLDAIERAKS